MTAESTVDKVEFGVTGQELGSLLCEQRKRIGLSQGNIANRLNYANINFISMIESGRSKIPVGRIDDFVSAYQMSPEFSLVILKVLYPDFLDVIFKVVKRVPRIFKEASSNVDEEINKIYVNTAAIISGYEISP